MPIPSSHMKEQLQFSYVNAVVARSGAKCTPPPSDYGMDVIISEVKILPDGSFTDTSFLFHGQLKATTRCKIRNDYVVYDLDVKTYNKLVQWEGNAPAILIVFKLPKNEQEWLNLDEDVLCMRNCCYWMRLEGKVSTNVSSKTIKIPREQVFDPQAVTYLLDQVRQGVYNKRG